MIHLKVKKKILNITNNFGRVQQALYFLYKQLNKGIFKIFHHSQQAKSLLLRDKKGRRGETNFFAFVIIQVWYFAGNITKERRHTDFKLLTKQESGSL
jgi:hypothetical protein